MELSFLPEGEEPKSIKPTPGVEEGSTEYLDYWREITDEELRQRWLDVDNDPALQLDWTDKGFHWTPEELHDAIVVAKLRLYWDDDTLDEYMTENGE